MSAAGLIEDALGGLREATGIAGKRLIDNVGGTQVAVALEVAGKTLHYRCELKQKIDRYLVLDDLKARSVVDQSTLLVSGPLTDAMASRCRELDIQFIDTAGNAYVTDGQGILINVTGRKLEKGSLFAEREMTITPAAIRMMFAFLASPSMLNAPYRDISISTRVSTGAIGKVLEVLDARGFIGTAPDGRRIIISPEVMLSEWATGYMSRLRPKLKKFRFTTPDPISFDRGDFQAAEGAAHRLYYQRPQFGGAYPLDLIPFGAIENNANTIAWPPDMAVVMNVIGYPEALRSAVQVDVGHRLIVNVVSIPALAALKLLAWNDRGLLDNKDAPDLFFLLRHYHEAGNTDRLYEEAFLFLENCDYDVELSGAALLGLLEILSDPVKRDRLVIHMDRSSGAQSNAPSRFLEQFERGLGLSVL